MQADLLDGAAGIDKDHGSFMTSPARTAEGERVRLLGSGVLNPPGADSTALRIRFPLNLMAAHRNTTSSGSVAVWLLSAVAVLSLLGAIGLVLSQAVRQGDSSRRAMALRAEVDWRCRALTPRVQREHCAALVQERQPGDSASVQALVQEARSAALRP